MARSDFIEWLEAAELHWFFIQGEQALERELYLPGTVALINGIEASIRFTLHRLDGKTLDDDLGATLSNRLIREARDRGLPVQTLAFPGERDFDAKLATRDPYVEVVRVRHNLAHGNIVEYVNREDDVFTPECLRDLSSILLNLSCEWGKQLGEFRKKACCRLTHASP
jgi:hypothetical protein